MPVQDVKRDTRPPFNPYDTTKVKHSKFGVWDFYEEIQPPRQFALQQLLGWQHVKAIKEGIPHLLQLVYTVMKAPQVMVWIVGYLGTSLLLSIIPAWTLWYSSQLLAVTQQALETGTVDQEAIRRIVIGSVVCSIASYCLSFLTRRFSKPLQDEFFRFTKSHILHAQMRLDLPTYEETSVQSQFDSAGENDVAWDAISDITANCGALVQLVAQTGVLVTLLSRQRIMLIYALLQIVPSLLPSGDNSGNLSHTTWAATTHSEQYKTRKGIDLVASEKKYRKELVAGNLQQFLLDRWNHSTTVLGGLGHNFHTEYRHSLVRFSMWKLILRPASALSHVLLLIQVSRNPMSLPTSYAAFALIRQVVSDLSRSIYILQSGTRRITEHFQQLRNLMELHHIPNVIQDGVVPFPESTQDLKVGISVEFKNVSFKYPQTDTYALRNATFKIEKGQLCVIVGKNGSGKSTLLKLLLRLYDPIEGDIFLNGQNLRTLRTSDVRKTVSALFQDFTIFPLSIADNIGLGDPSHAKDQTRIEQAAEMGGAASVVEKLPYKYKSYIESPVYNSYSNLPEGTLSLFGLKDLTTSGDGWSQESHELSGGEMQRLALSRSFMRSMNTDNEVALLLYDEPSASLDPEAEYALFERLRELRGSKTMVFSSHRFGNLTRHADLILFAKDASVTEQGTHSQLLAMDGGYAAMYKIQAAAFQDA